jgi:hypothetical protein
MAYDKLIMDEKIDEKTLNFLVDKSRILLNEQLKSYEVATKKAGTFLSILSLILPIAIYVLSKDVNCFIRIIGTIPILLFMIAMIYQLKVWQVQIWNTILHLLIWVVTNLFTS